MEKVYKNYFYVKLVNNFTCQGKFVDCTHEKVDSSNTKFVKGNLLV
jgi:hypothetical protein